MVAEYIDIREKQYSTQVGDVTFYFTSLRHKEQFDERQPERSMELKRQYLSRYKTNCDTTILGAFDIYRRVELRDFLVNLNGKDITDYRSVIINMQAMEA